jgi:hypothetical protein
MVIIRGRGRGTNYSNGLDLRYFHNHRKNIIIFLLEFGPRGKCSSARIAIARNRFFKPFLK